LPKTTFINNSIIHRSQNGSDKYIIRMNIAIIGSRGYPFVYSGYETFVKELAERLVQMDVEVHVYCHRNLFKTYPKKVNGVHLHYIPTIETKSLSQLIHSFISMLHASFSSVDVILVVNAANGPLGWIPKMAGKKTLINVDGLEWLRPKWKGMGSKYFYFAAKTATKLYDKIITDADAMRDVYLKEFNSDSKVIAYGAPKKMNPASDLIERWSLKNREYYFIVGRLIPDNNADLIIQGFLESRTEKKLVIVGDVMYKDNYADNLKALQQENLIFTGYINDSNELMALYQNCFAYIHGHKFGGTNPAMLKAMANDCAILALDTPFNREMLNNGEFGVLFQENSKSIAQHINMLEKDEDKVTLLRSKVSKGLTEKYNWDNIANAYLSAMIELTTSKS
jgi:glycosyltransferase involved in cell wall biosynthesis